MSAVVQANPGFGHALSDYATLLKLRIATFVGLAAFVGGLLAADSSVGLLRIAEAALWITVAAGSASAFNQIVERRSDALMERTRGRPLPAGRLSTRAALVFALALFVVSTLALWLRFNALSAGLSVATIASYAFVYTPLKQKSTINTVVGAIPGAAPPLLGYAALAGEVHAWAWTLFAILFVWQFPHFMAIAWLHRHDYSRAGMRMLPSANNGERLAGKAAILYGLMLLPVSMVPALFGGAGVVFLAGTLGLGLCYCAASILFAFKPERSTARTLLLTSLAYLPLVLALVVFDPATGILAAHFTR